VTLRIRFHHTFVLLALALALAATSARALTYSWSAASGLLPDQTAPVAWDLYSTAGQPQLSDGMLTLNSPANGSAMMYLMPDAGLAMPAAFDFSATLRITADSTSNSARRGTVIGFTTDAYTGNGLYIGSDGIFLLSDNLTVGAFAAVDTTAAFHTYEIAVSGTAAGSLINVYYDGATVPLLSGVTFSHPSTFGAAPEIYWGNAGALAHGTSEWLSVTHNAAAIPEPATAAALLGAASLGVVLRRRRGRS